MGELLRHLYACTPDRAPLDEAISVARRVVDLTAPASGNLPGYLGNLTAHLSELYGRSTDLRVLDEAIATARRAVDVCASTSGLRGQPAAVLRLLRLRFSELLMRRDARGDWAEAAAQLVSALRQQQDELGRQQGEPHIQRYLRPREDLYPVAVRCLLVMAERCEDRGRQDEAAEWRRAAWQAMEEGKGRVFAALLAADSAAFATSRDQQAAIERIDELRARLGRLEELPHPPPSDGPGRAPHGPASKGGRAACQTPQTPCDWMRIHTNLIRELGELARGDPELAGLTANGPLPLEEVRRALHCASLLALYPLSDRMALFRLDGASLRVASAPLGRDRLAKWTAQWAEATGGGSAAADAVRRWDPEAAEALLAQLGGALAAPLVELLGPPRPQDPGAAAPPLLVAPAGDLHLWPLHLLPWGSGVLWEAFAVSYLPTADTLCYCSARAAAPGRPRLLAPDPSLPGSYAEAALATALGWECLLGEDAAIDALCRAAPEVAVASHYHPGQHASEAALLLGGPAGIMPVSGHEVFVRRRGQPPAEHWGVGTCSAHRMAGDDLQGLMRALLRGARSVQSTLWPLDDLCGCYLGGRVRELRAAAPQRSKAACLRQAALELRDGGWAGMAGWLEDRASGVGRALLLSLAAATRLQGGDLPGFHALWPQAPPTGPYGPAVETLASAQGLAAVYDAAEAMRAAMPAAAWAALRTESVEMTPLHWGPSILLGAPWTGEHRLST